MNKFLSFLVALAVILTAFAPLDIGQFTYYVVIDPLVGSALVSGGLGLLGSVGSGLIGSSSASSQTAAQQRWNWMSMMQQYLNQRNLIEQSAGIQSKQNEQLFGYQKQLLDYMQKYQSDQWQKQWNAETEYNSPAAMARRLASAGFNPSVMIGNGQSVGGAATSPSVSSPSASFGGSPPVAPGVAAKADSFPTEASISSHQAQTLRDLTGSLAAIIKAPFEVKEKKAATELTYRQMSNLVADENYKKSLTIAQGIDNEVNARYKGKHVEKMIDSLQANIDLAYLHGDLAKSEKALNEVKEKLTNEEFIKLSKENEYLYAMLVRRVKLLDEQIQTQKSEQTRNVAEAHEHDAGARLKNVQSDVENIKKEIDIETKAQKIETKLRELEASQFISEAHAAEAARRLELVRKRQNWRHDNNANRTLDDVLNYLADAVGLSASLSVSPKD